MAIDLSGQDKLPRAGTVAIHVDASHPLILLASILCWQTLIDLVIEDLKKTTKKGFWWMGRKIRVRMHLAAYLLQTLYDYTDRKMEYQIKDNAAFQIFCGIKIVEGWHAPDHTKIEEFRNRLSVETKKTLANAIAQAAVNCGFADPRQVDFDSTVQEANIAYPSDANLMCKLGGIGKKFVDHISQTFPHLLNPDIFIDIKGVKKRARDYFFLAKNKPKELKREIFKKLHKLVKKQMKPVVDLCQKLTEDQVTELPWNIKRAFDQIKNDAWRYLLDVGHFTRTHSLKAGKILSFHAKELTCIKKGKLGKEHEFGRVFQLGRIKGNFLFALQSHCVAMNDKTCFVSLLEDHAKLFGEENLETIAVDKGYWSSKNEKFLQSLGVATAGLQRPANIKNKPKDLDLEEHLRNRRAGIEPLIGHVKHGGQLGKSRMKTDTGTLGAGYGSILGFNLRQMIRYQQGKITMAT